jgi:GAG-pre-integrase domain/Integrase core domain
MQGHSAHVTTSRSLRLWHRRLGHLHLDVIQEMMQKNMVKGLTISSPDEYDHVCEGCALGKSHRLPFPKASSTQYKQMDLLVVDLTGPMSVETWSGMQYAFVAVEISCRLPVGRLLRSKDEAGTALKETVAMLEQQSGKLLKRIRCDNGTEFTKNLIDSFCRHNGVILETTVPYSPEQNGIAERAIAIIFDMVRCMLHSARMDLRYWGEAFLYAVHIWSCSYTSALKGMVTL